MDKPEYRWYVTVILERDIYTSEEGAHTLTGHYVESGWPESWQAYRRMDQLRAVGAPIFNARVYSRRENEIGHQQYGEPLWHTLPDRWLTDKEARRFGLTLPIMGNKE